MNNKMQDKKEILKKVSKGEMTSTEAMAIIKELKQISDAEIKKVIKEDNQILYYEALWEKSPLASKEIKTEKLNNVIIFALNPEDKNTFEKLIGNKDAIMIYSGKSFNKINNREYKISSVKAEDYLSLFSELIKDEIYPETIINFWSSELPFSHALNVKNSEKMLNVGVAPIFHIIKALHHHKLQQLNRFISVIDHAQEMVNPFSFAIKGFAGSLNKSMPKLNFSTLELPMHELSVERTIEIIANELSCEDKFIQQDVRYKNDERYIRKIEAFLLEPQLKNVLKKEGIYLITGGGGGLGLVLSRHLTAHYNAKIFITGRSELTQSKISALQEINQSGGEVTYLRANVGNMDEMNNIISTIKEKHGELNGVLHIAGLPGSMELAKKEIKAFKETLFPKVQGTLVLDEVTKDENLDFMLFFSSASSILGDFGQGDYSVSNRFLDGYTAFREALRNAGLRKGFTKVINWPLWRDGGMHLDKNAEELYLKTSGMTYLENHEGMESLEKILNSNETGAILFSGNKVKIQNFINKENQGKVIDEKTVPKDVTSGSFKTNAPKSASLSKKVEFDVTEMASKIIKIPASKLDIHENLGAFGFDSISLKELGDKIGMFYGIEVSPVVFFAQSDIKGLCAYILSEFPERIKGLYAVENPNETITGNPFKENLVETNLNKNKETKQDTAVSTIQKRLNAIKQNRRDKESVAIIGMSSVFPGSRNMDEYWENLEQGKNSIGEIPIERWDWRDYYSNDPSEANKTNIIWGGFIEDADKFDAGFFNISPREAELMDPQQRLFLQASWKAIEDSGYKSSDLGGRSVGVFVGAQFTDYQDIMDKDVGVHAPMGTGNAHALLSNRVSYLLNFKGPSESIDTACSSALVAVHRAVKSVQSGESELAIAGGVSLMISPYMYIGAAKLGVLSPDGKCKTFDKSANGYVRGEGVGAILLKPLSKAIEDGDHIYAVIKSSAESHGGKANSLTAPNSEAQAALLVKAYEEAGFEPESISYIETHGTGTELGDPTEINGLKKGFADLAKKQGHEISKSNYCGIGSVKTNIGHLEPASGIAGLTKLVLSLKNKKLPGILHFNELNPYIELENSPFYIVKEAKYWEPLKDDKGNDMPRRTGVSAFGFGGTYAHVVLEEYENKASTEGLNINDDKRQQLFVLSAKNKDALKAYALELKDYLNRHNDLSFSDIAYTLQVGRNSMVDRLAIIAKDQDELLLSLQDYINDNYEKDHIFVGNIKESSSKYQLIVNDERGIQYLNDLISDRKLDTLAQLYVNGIDIEWKDFYQNTKPNRVSLPTYPFAKEHYWLPESMDSTKKKKNSTSFAKAKSSTDEEPQILFYTKNWEPSEINEKRNDLAGNILLFDMGQEQANRLKQSMKSNGSIHVVCPSTKYNMPHDSSYEVIPDNEDDYITLLSDLKEKSIEIDTIAFLWPTLLNEETVNTEFSISVETCDKYLSMGLNPLYYLFRAMAKTKTNTVKRIVAPYIAKNDIANPFFEAFSGFSRSLLQIWPKLVFTSLKINIAADEDRSDAVHNALMHELTLSEINQKPEVVYDQEGRTIRKMKALDNASYQDTDIVQFRQKGIYLITGGMGALGLITARHLAKTYQARLILIGRSEMDRRKEDQLKELNKIGGEAIYISADTSNIEEMKNAVALAKQTFGEINGVLHIAGTAGPNIITKKEYQEYLEGLRPKIQGTLALDDATKEEALDLFIMYSSASAILGDFGQCDYSVGNSFLDSYTLYRESLRKNNLRKGRTVSINWPTWREGGMHLNQESEHLYLKSSGMSYLETKDGMEALEKIIKSGLCQTLVMAGEKTRIEKFLNAAHIDGAEEARKTTQMSKAALTRKSVTRSISNAMLNNGLTIPEKLEAELVKIASEILKIETEKFRVNENLGEYGFDSISLKELGNKIGELFHVEIAPTVFFEYSTLEGLCRYMTEEYREEIEAFFESYDNEASMQFEVADIETFDYEDEEDIILSFDYENKFGSYKALAHEPVAIIGVSGIYPGSKDLEEFWYNLENEKDLITEIPSDRWDWKAFYSEDPTEANKTKAKWGGFIDDVDKFDAQFFNISPREAQLMDPQQRLFLQTTWKAIEDSGHKPSEFWGRNVGVFVGMQFDDYLDLMGEDSAIQAQTGTGNAHALLCNRISYILNLKGPSESIDTACSSALVAVHRAVKSIQNGESELAIAGGVSLMFSPYTFIGAAKLGILSEDGRCKTFDESANGYVKGEGIGSLLLKPLSKAVEDQDPIYAVIKGTVESHGGRANSLTAPNAEAQAAMLVKVYEEAGIAPETVSYIEAHGTGTQLGDPTEINGLKKAFADLAEKQGRKIDKFNFCGLGSVKTNIGHLEPASGIVGLTKLILALKNKRLPGVVHLKTINPYIHLEDTPFYIVDHTQDWNTLKDNNGNALPRRAGVSSFGFGGTYAHIIVEEFIQKTAQINSSYQNNNNEPQLILISAKNNDSLKNNVKEMAKFIARQEKQLQETDKNENKISLRDIAYTLQVGREAMEERLAIIVRSSSELLNKLNQFLEDVKDIEGFCYGSILHNAKTKTRFEIDQENELIKGLIANKNLQKLAEYWTSGSNIEWEMLHTEYKPKRISLPTYAFAKVRHWIPTEDIKTAGNQGMSKLHPMVYSNTSTFEEQRFTTVLKGDEFFLADHIVEGNRILPGVAYLEMAKAAAELSGLIKVKKIKDILWMRPIVSSNTVQEVHISLFPDGNEIIYEVSTKNDGQKAIIHGQGRMVVENLIVHNTIDKENTHTAIAAIDIASIQKKCTKHILGNDCYRDFKSIGFEYGKSFQAIKESFVGEEEIIARLELPEHLGTDFNLFGLHPSLIDGALQAISGFVDDHDRSETYVPFALGEIEIFGPLKEKCFSYVTLASTSSKVRKFNVMITDEAGTVLVKIKDFSLRALNSHNSETDSVIQQEVSLQASKPEALYYTYGWEKKALNISDKPNNAHKNILIFYSDEKTGEALKAKLNAKGYQTILVKQGEAFKQTNDREFVIDIQAQEDYEHLFAILKASNIMPTHIVHLMNVISDLFTDVHVNIASLFNLNRGLILQKPVEATKILYVYDNSKAENCPQLMASGALLKTVSLENTKIAYKTLGLDTSNGSELSGIVFEELESHDNEVMYRNKDRYVHFIVNAPAPQSTDHDDSMIKETGVYIITGGAGGLGMLFAEHFAKNYMGVKIVLTGRSDLAKDKIAKIKSLNQNGTEVIYIKADISKEDGARKLIEETKEKFQGINGIIHAAGVIKDAFLINKKPQDIHEVLAPKVFGTYWLDIASKDENLDFFVMFSSTTAVFGNAGQADYAYANSYMNDYARYRDSLQKDHKRHGKTLSICWPLWENGGMHIDNQTKKLFEDNYGMTLLETNKGIKAFELSLSSNNPQMILLEGYKDKLNTLVTRINNPENIEAEVTAIEIDLSELLKKVQKDLQIIMSEILKVKPEEMSIHTELNKFGFDSITFTDFSNRLNDQYKLHVMPSVFYEHTTLSSFIHYLVETYKDILMAYYHEDQKSVITKPVMEVEIAPIEERAIRSRFRNTSLISSEMPVGFNEPIAIIGMSGVMPESENLEVFWENLEAGKDLITEVPADRWDWKAIYGDPMIEANKTNIKWGGFMPRVDTFDAKFFGISPREAELMDPQQRIFLETVYKTIEDAGYTTQDMSGTATGVFVGVGTSDYSDLLKEREVELQAQTTTGMAHSVLVNRISFLLNLHGPSEPIDTACSSSLTAIHRAVEAIHLGNCEMAIAGGINVIASPTLFISLRKAGMLCEDGRCKTFDESANGYVRGEGTGAILLKPLSKAVKDGDHIYALIKGSDVNHGGAVNSLTTPNPNAQAEVIMKAWKRAAIDPSTVNYIEAHGTGTSLGDPIEINGLKKAFGQLYKEWDKTPIQNTCGIGSVKSNIGHLEPGAGIASVLKVLLALKNKKIPASIHVNKLNPYIELTGSPFYIVDKTIEWQKNSDAPRRAGISSFGFGGTNAHIVLEEYEMPDGSIIHKNEPHIITLSAKNETRLKAYAKELVDFINQTWFKETTEISVSEIMDKLTVSLKEIASQIINVPVNEIDVTESTDEYGFDPITLSKFYEMIADKFELPVIDLKGLGYSSVINIAHNLYDKYPDHLNKYYELSVSETTDANKSDITLTEMAYTLQIGRDSMAERLAIICETPEELKEILNQYLNDKKDIHNLYLGSVAHNKQKSATILDGEDGKEIVELLLNKKKLDKLALLWVSGAEVQWKQLYKDSRINRISLPTYPFAKERYWVPEAKNKNAAMAVKQDITQLHPMLDKNTSTLEEQKFTTILTGNEFFVQDHVVKGKKVLPGVAYMEMARAAGELSGIANIRTIKDLVWARPITLDHDEKEVQISLFPENNHIEFEVNTFDAHDALIMHSQGKVLQEAIYENIIPSMDFESIKERCDHVISQEMCYRDFKEMKLEYGSSFQSIKTLYSGKGEALAFLELPKNLEGSFHKFVLHPAIMDGALQAISGIHQDQKDSTTYLPFALGELRILSTLQSSCYAHVTYVESASNVNKFNIEIADLNGQILLTMKDLTLKAAGKPIEAASLLYYNNDWENQELSANEIQMPKEPILILDKDMKIYSELKAVNAHVILIKHGEKFKKINDDQYEINTAKYEDYTELFELLKSNNQMPENILHLLNLNSNAAEQAIIEEPTGHLEEQLQSSAYSMFHLSRALMAQKPKASIKLIYAYNTDKTVTHSLNEAVAGMLKTVSLEYSKITAKSVGIDSYSTAESIKVLMAELKDTQLQIRYNNHERQVKVLNAFNPLKEILSDNQLLKNKGVYIITGGVGGLGLIFAQYLAEKYEARLVLTGRSEPNADKKNRIEQLKRYGAEAVYIQADITKNEDVERLIGAAKAKFHEINGIIHSAGITRDAYLLNKTLSEMAQVIAPKVHGTLYLDRATKNEPLDLFVMFSSVSGVRGNAGQADYAYANSFMDSFASYREEMRQNGNRFGKTVSINWPLWQEGGMKVDAETQKLMEKNFGMMLLQTKNGIDAFELSLRQQKNQLMVIEGVESKINNSIYAGKAVEFENSIAVNDKSMQLAAARVASATASKIITAQDRIGTIEPSGILSDTSKQIATTENNLLGNIQKSLKELVNQLLKISEQDIDLDTDMSEFGFDSISFTEFANQISNQYQIQVMPNVFYEHSELRALSEYLLETYRESFERFYGIDIKSDTNNDFSTKIADYNSKDVTNFVQYEITTDQVKIPVQNDESVIALDSNKDDVNTVNPRRRNRRFMNIGFTQESKQEVDDIAIIGLSGRYPMADTVDAFWENLKASKNCISEIPSDRWDYKQYYNPDKNNVGTSYSKWGGFIENIDMFDPLFFNISPRDAQFMDPQERIFLETVWNTMEDAGYTKSQLSSKKVGVYVGVMYGEYQLYGAEETLMGNPMSLTSSYASIANRVSYYFDLKGPSMALDTMCSSSLSALHLACESLYRGETEMSIVGGVNATLHPNKYLMLSQGKFLASDGKCHSYGDNGDGYVPGEGVGAILLKPLKKAKEEGDYIYGIIKSVSVNHGGRTGGYTIPNPKAQAEVILESLKKSNIDPRTISYIEGQGTGTPIGDPIEIAALSKAYKHYTQDKQYCSVGSVKSNIGHLESAGGIAGITKVLLQMKHKKLVPSLHSEKVNPSIKFEETPFYLQHTLADWQQPVIDGQKYPRRAAINSFGAGGSNVHVIIEEFENKPCVKKHNEHIVVLSAKNTSRLKEYASKLSEFISNHLSLSIDSSGVTLDNLAYTLQIGKETFDERLAICTSSLEALVENLKAYSDGNINNDIMFLGNSGKMQSDLNMFLEGKEGETYIKTIMKDRKFDKLARLWVSGVNVDWKLLYEGEYYSRVSLPTYPFAKERYWIPNSYKNINQDLINNVTETRQNQINQMIEQFQDNKEVIKAAQQRLNKINDSELVQENNFPIIKAIDQMPVNHDRNSQLYQEVLNSVKTITSEVLEIDQDALEIEMNLYEYGINSISLVQIGIKIQEAFDLVDLPASIFNQETLKGITNCIYSELLLVEHKTPIDLENLEVKSFEPVERKAYPESSKAPKIDGSTFSTKNILINGVTGVLGGRLIKEYLEKTDSILYCIIRGNDIEHARERIKEMLGIHDPSFKLWTQHEQRIIPIIGDIVKPMLGLTAERYNALAEVIDMVVHVAAKTSLHGFYDELKIVNVDGTRNMIDFALKTRQKYFVHTSTIAVRGDRQYKNCAPFTEKDYDLGQGFKKMGYERSKFEAEHLVRSAEKEGLNWIIIRSGYIMGDSQNGYYPFGKTSVPGIFYDFIKTAIEMKMFYNSPFQYDITPVDYIGKGVLYLTTKVKAINQTYHLNNPTSSTLNDVMSYINKYGYEIDIVNFDEFIDALESKDNRYNSVTTQLIRLNPTGSDALGFSYVDSTYTKNILEKGNIICPRIDEKLIGTYLDYCIEVGYIKKPKKSKGRK